LEKHNRANQEGKEINPQPQQEDELSDQELEQVSGGITPIPIPELDLSQYLQKSIKLSPNPALNPKGFEGGGGIG
jgi:bacteriocin-like protein